MTDYALADALRRLERMIIIAKVTATKGKKVKVDLGTEGSPAESNWLDVLPLSAGIVKIWIPVSVGSQVMVLSPGGDTSCGLVLPAVFSKDADAPSTDQEEVKIEMPGITMSAKNGVTNLSLKTAHVKGDIIVDGDVIASGISLVKHKHSGIRTGGSVSGKPVG